MVLCWGPLRVLRWDDQTALLMGLHWVPQKEQQWAPQRELRKGPR